MVLPGTEGITQDSFPQKWQCESDSKAVAVEVRVPNERSDTGYTWIEIPTQNVEQWIEKGDSAQIQRTAKVEFPTVWGRDDKTVVHNSPRKLIEQFDSTDSSPFMVARIWWGYEDRVLQHFGWVGGVGSTGDNGISKFWVYDFAELLSGVPIGETFNDPTVKDALDKIAALVNGNTPTPVSDTTIVAPNTAEEFDILAQDISVTGDLGELVGPILSRIGVPQERPIGVLGEDTSLAPTNGVVGFPTIVEYYVDQIAGEGSDVEPPTDNIYDSLTIDTQGLFEIFNIDNKSFVANRDTILDVWRWFEDKTNAKLHFEPLPNSVLLVADIVPTRHRFASQNVIEYQQDQDDEYAVNAATIVTENNALYEMKPLNTLHLKGATPGGYLDEAQDYIEGAIGLVAGPPPAEKYPSVTVQQPQLLDAAEGVRLSPEMVESDAETLDSAIREAKRKLSDKISEASEGTIDLLGTPTIMPYDRLDAFEVCNDIVQYGQEPVTYEVESIKHTASADDVYRTNATVSIWANEQNIEVVEDETLMKEVEA